MKTSWIVTALSLFVGMASAGCGLESPASMGGDTDRLDPDETETVTQSLGNTFSERTLPARGGGGGAFNGHVTPPAVIYGVQVNSGRLVDRITFYYYQPSRPDNIYAGEATASVTFGGNGGANINPVFVCPTNQGVIGLRGASGKYVDRIGVICGNVTTPDPASPSNAFSPLWGGGGGAFFEDRCEFGRLVDSFNIRNGSVVDNLQAMCINAQ
jgi:hypothetical protein